MKRNNLLKVTFIGLIVVRIFMYSISFYSSYQLMMTNRIASDGSEKVYKLEVEIRGISLSKYGAYQVEGKINRASGVNHAMTFYESLVMKGKIIQLYLGVDEIKGLNTSINQFAVSTVQVSGAFDPYPRTSNPGQTLKWIRPYSTKSLSRFRLETIKVLSTGNVYRRVVRKIGVFCQEITMKINKQIDLLYNQPTNGILNAMILGEKESLDNNVKELFQIHGISHVLAISGLHISMLFIFVDYFLRSVHVEIRLRFILLCVIFLIYNIMLGLVFSSIRATLMMVVYYYSKAFGYPYRKERSFYGVLMLNLLVFPEKVLDCGFLLSYGAVFALFFVYPRFTFLIRLNNSLKLRWVLDMLLINWSIMIITGPVLVYFFGGISITSFLGNVMIVPLMFCFYGLSLLSILISIVIPDLAFFMAGSIDMITNYFLFWCEQLLMIYNQILYIPKLSLLEVVVYYLCVVLLVTYMRGLERKLCV